MSLSVRTSPSARLLQLKEHFYSSRTTYQIAHPTLSPLRLNGVGYSTLIFIPHSHQRDKWFDCCTGRARGILMDAVLIRGFVNSQRKHTLCTRCFPRQPSAEITPDRRSWQFTSESYPSILCRLDTQRLRRHLAQVDSLTGPKLLLSSLRLLVCLFGRFLFITINQNREQNTQGERGENLHRSQRTTWACANNLCMCVGGGEVKSN